MKKIKNMLVALIALLAIAVAPAAAQTKFGHEHTSECGFYRQTQDILRSELNACQTREEQTELLLSRGETFYCHSMTVEINAGVKASELGSTYAAGFSVGYDFHWISPMVSYQQRPEELYGYGYQANIFSTGVKIFPLSHESQERRYVSGKNLIQPYFSLEYGKISHIYPLFDEGMPFGHTDGYTNLYRGGVGCRFFVGNHAYINLQAIADHFMVNNNGLIQKNLSGTLSVGLGWKF